MATNRPVGGLHRTLGTRAVHDAAAYLGSCEIRLPHFKLTTNPPEERRYGGSFVDSSSGSLRLNIGNYPTTFLRNWFAMHELGHILWASHQPLRWKRFRYAFGDPAPEDYERLAAQEAWKTPTTWRFSWFPGLPRPTGQPSWYGARAGGQERFCETLSLMWANGDFSKPPPADLAELWDVCWDHGLSRMT